MWPGSDFSGQLRDIFLRRFTLEQHTCHMAAAIRSVDSFPPNSEMRRERARLGASRTAGRALAENLGAQKYPKRSCQFHAQELAARRVQLRPGRRAPQRRGLGFTVHGLGHQHSHAAGRLIAAVVFTLHSDGIHAAITFSRAVGAQIDRQRPVIPSRDRCAGAGRSLLVTATISLPPGQSRPSLRR